MDLKITDSSLKIYISGERVATHTKFPDYITNHYATHDRTKRKLRELNLSELVINVNMKVRKSSKMESSKFAYF